MRLWHIVTSRLRSLFRHGGREADLREELQLHLEAEAERLRADGLSAADSLAEARRAWSLASAGATPSATRRSVSRST